MLFLPVEKLLGRNGDGGLWSQPVSPAVHFPSVTLVLSLNASAQLHDLPYTNVL